MNVLTFKEKKRAQKKISILTCYDFWTAQILNESDVDAILVGDSLAMVVHGHSTTLPATTELICSHTTSVAKGAPNKFIIADMPFMSFRTSFERSVECATKLMQSGAHAIKLEGAKGNLELVSHLVESGIPVMGHLGLTPQSVNQLGGFKVQGRDKEKGEALMQESLALQKAGAFALVLECVPSSLASIVTESLDIPTIGIGAGPDTSGQVLVMQDMLGMNKGFKPKFVRHFLEGHQLLKEAFNEFHNAVQEKKFPSHEESYE